jgi:hypothetical protein
LNNKKAFREYLEKQYDEKSSFPFGNLLNSQMVQIKAAGLLEECCKFIDSKQNAKNGLWEDDITFRSISGLMKLSAIYIHANRRMNMPEKISESIFSLLKSKEGIDQIVFIYNPISALSQQIYMLKLVDESYEASRLTARLNENAYDIVRSTADKLRIFAKPDGSYSYSPDFSAARSQNVPTALKESREGDANATNIASGGVISTLLSNLGISPKTFDADDFEEFISILRSQKPIIKLPTPEERFPYTY